MEKTITLQGLQVRVTSDEDTSDLREDSILTVWTGDYGLAALVTQLFLAEQGRKDLWYHESGSTGSDSFYEITLKLNLEENWKGWSRKRIMKIVRSEKTKLMFNGQPQS